MVCLHARRLGVPLLLLLSCAGCQVFQRYRPLVVQVRDAETKKPIDQAWIGITYPRKTPFTGPSESHGTTAGDGIARLQAVPNGEDGLVVAVRADAYMPEEQFVSAGDVGAIDPSHWFEAVERRPATVVLELYAVEPRPTVELILPAGYRGMVKADLKVNETVPCAPGQRHFTFSVPATGVVEAPVPPVFGHTAFPGIRARYAGGPLLTDSAKEQEVGFWWVKSEGNVHTYLVGTANEYARYHPPPRESGESKRSGGGGGRGRGGKHGGGQQQPDTSSGGSSGSP